MFYWFAYIMFYFTIINMYIMYIHIWYYNHNSKHLMLLVNALALLGTRDKTELLSCVCIITLLLYMAQVIASDYHT